MGPVCILIVYKFGSAAKSLYYYFNCCFIDIVKVMFFLDVIE